MNDSVDLIVGFWNGLKTKGKRWRSSATSVVTLEKRRSFRRGMTSSRTRISRGVRSATIGNPPVTPAWGCLADNARLSVQRKARRFRRQIDRLQSRKRYGERTVFRKSNATHDGRRIRRTVDGVVGQSEGDAW